MGQPVDDKGMLVFSRRSVSSQVLASLFFVACVWLGMGIVDIEMILKQAEERLARAGELPSEAQQALEDLLNLVEHLVTDQATLRQEVQRLKQQLDNKRRAKTTHSADDDKPDSDHSSEKHRRKRQEPRPRSASDRRSFKDLTIHETIECRIDSETLPPDAVRMEDESIVVQDIQIKPRNICFQRQVYYSAAENKCFRGPLPSGYDAGDFGADLRALILSLKYCGNMSDPRFRLGEKTVQLLRTEFDIPQKWGLALEQLGEIELDKASLAALLDDWFGAALQRYRDGPTALAADRLRLQFDALFATRTGYGALDERIAKTAAKKEELLTVLDHPEVPLHNNASELGARVSVRRRDVGLHSRSIRGARTMDIFTTLVQTCKKLGISAYAYLRDRLTHRHAMPSLAASIRTAASV